MADPVKLTLYGRCMVKKNGQKVVRTRFGVKKINTTQYNNWHSKAFIEGLKQRPTQFNKISTPMNASFVFYFKNHQSEADLSNLIEGPQDLLKELGFILDDKLIYSLDGSKKIFNKQELERVEIMLTILENEISTINQEI